MTYQLPFEKDITDLPLYHVVWIIEKEAAAAVAAGTAVAVTAAAAATPAASAGASTADATPKTERSDERGRGGCKKYVLHLE